MKRSRHHNIDFPYVYSMLGVVIVVFLIIALCVVCSTCVPLL